VREFGMAAVMNGVALHGGFIPYGGTFLTFSDYSRNAIRMAALMKQRVVHVFTHDSIGLGEDGPTHQPVEHVPSPAPDPGLDVWRPCRHHRDRRGLGQALQRRDGPAALAAVAPGAAGGAPRRRSGGHRAAATCWRPQGRARRDHRHRLRGGNWRWQAQALLDAQGLPVRVVSMPCSTVFDRQDRALPRQRAAARPAGMGMEAGVTRWWGLRSTGGVAAARAADVPVVVTRSAYFAQATIEGAIAIGPGLHRREGWRPALPDHGEGRTTLADLHQWRALADTISQFA
jgi:transketolase